MSLVQTIKDGKIAATNASSISDSTTKTSSNSALDKDAFLQLLVAQMKYQDPLEPTSNTEYIAQLATFSQLEATQNLEKTIDSSNANDLVGKAVIMKTTSSSTGDTYYTAGYVDAVKMEEGKPYLYINSSYYALSDLDTVLDEEYYEEYLEGVKSSSGSGTGTTGTDTSGTGGTGTGGTAGTGTGTGGTAGTGTV
jgi:flagellar basal-body rod modification protein FlgD